MRWVAMGRTGADVDRAVADAQQDGSVLISTAGPDLEGSAGGAGMSWDLVAAADTDAFPGHLPDGVLAAPVHPIGSGGEVIEGPHVKRTLLLTVRPDTPAETVERFEAGLLEMPEHIPAIRTWTLSRVERDRAGEAPWTHAWEQEFTGPEGLLGDYLLHPFHWTYVDRWFDPEMPDSIVEPGFAHLYRQTEVPVLLAG